MDLAAFGPITELMNSEPGRAAYGLRKLILQLQDSFNALEEARFPVIAAIHGACIGGGIDMITACDIRLATHDAYFSIEEINIGMAADVGTLQRLPKLIAPGIVKELAYTGRKFSGEEAKQWGLVNALHKDHSTVVEAALNMATQIATKSPLAISGIKHAIDYTRDHPVPDALNQIATWNAGMLRPEDLMGAIQAKMAKKEAVFADLLGE
jgi:enoyl-CoA hydratase